MSPILQNLIALVLVTGIGGFFLWTAAVEGWKLRPTLARRIVLTNPRQLHQFIAEVTVTYRTPRGRTLTVDAATGTGFWYWSKSGRRVSAAWDRRLDAEMRRFNLVHISQNPSVSERAPTPPSGAQIFSIVHPTKGPAA